MRHTLIVLCTAFLLVAAKPVSQLPTTRQIEQISKTSNLIIHSFHVTLTGSDANSYVVQIDFNLSTQQFGVITCHNVSTPGTEQAVTRLGGVGSTYYGNGSTIRIIVDLEMSTTGSVTFILPASSTDYTFDY